MLLTTQQALASQYPTVQPPASQPGLPGLQGFFNNPLIGLAAGLLQGASPGGTFAGGLNLGLVNAQNMARQQAATALLGQQLKDAQYLRILREQQMAAQQRLGQQYPQMADFWAAGIPPPQVDKGSASLQKYNELLQLGKTPEEASRLAYGGTPLVQNIVGGDSNAIRALTPEERAITGLGENQPAYMTGKGEVKTPASENVQTAGVRAGVQTAQRDLEIARDIWRPDGKWSTSALALKDIPGTEGNRALSAMTRAIETELRIRTGAAAPKDEVDRRLLMYVPSVMDNDQAKTDKLNAFESFIKGVGRELSPRQKASEKTVPVPSRFSEPVP